MEKRIAVVSGKGGVGKTTITACLGDALANEGHRVLVMDGDFGLRDLDLVLGKENEVLYDAVDVWNKECRKKEALIEVSPNFYFMPASQQYRWEDVEIDTFGKLVKKMAKKFDYLLLDAPAGVGTGFESILSEVDMVLLVVEPNWVSIRNAQKVMQVCRDHRFRHVEVVMNNISPVAMISKEEAAQALQLEFLGTYLPYNEEFRVKETALGWKHNKAFSLMMRPLLDAVVQGESWDCDTVFHYVEEAMPKASVQPVQEVQNKMPKLRLLDRQRQSRWHRRYR